MLFCLVKDFAAEEIQFHKCTELAREKNNPARNSETLHVFQESFTPGPLCGACRNDLIKSYVTSL